MKIRLFFLPTLFLGLAMVLFFTSCESDDDDDENETLVSQNNGDKSHNAGQNCMNCHKADGSGEGWFVIAGTVYDSLQVSSNPNGSVRLYTEQNGGGNLIATISVDSKGNFFTTNQINFEQGLYVSVRNISGDIKYMSASVSIGECNSCHGSTTDRIWVR